MFFNHRKLIFIGALLSYAFAKAQQDPPPADVNVLPEVVDSLYREDQFYVGFTYNLFLTDSDRYSERGFSGGLHAGFIRDFPVNKRRNWAIGIGLGLSTNTVSSNMLVTESDGDVQFNFPSENITDPDRNRFNTNLVELPIQLRWRTSTPTTFSFWRIYPGFRMGYIFYARSIIESADLNLETDSFDDLNRWRFAATLSVGNGNFNAFFYYALNPLFQDGGDISPFINVTPLKFGFEFYLL